MKKLNVMILVIALGFMTAACSEKQIQSQSAVQPEIKQPEKTVIPADKKETKPLPVITQAEKDAVCKDVAAGKYTTYEMKTLDESGLDVEKFKKDIRPYIENPIIDWPSFSGRYDYKDNQEKYFDEIKDVTFFGKQGTKYEKLIGLTFKRNKKNIVRVDYDNDGNEDVLILMDFWFKCSYSYFIKYDVKTGGFENIMDMSIPYGKTAGCSGGGRSLM